MSFWLPRYLVIFRKSYLRIAVQLSTGNTAQVAAAIHAGTAELGFVDGEVAEPALVSRAIARDKMIVAIGAAAIEPSIRLETSKSSIGSAARPGLIVPCIKPAKPTANHGEAIMLNQGPRCVLARQPTDAVFGLPFRRAFFAQAALALAAKPARADNIATLPLPGDPRKRPVINDFPQKHSVILQRSRPPGRNYQPTENELNPSHLKDVTLDEAREIDRLYNQLLAAHPGTTN